MSSPAGSFDRSLRKSNSDISAVSGISNLSKHFPPSKRLSKGLKEHVKSLIDVELFTQKLQGWVSENLLVGSFASPFEISELQKLDFALEGVLLQQLCRMPHSPYSSSDDEIIKEDTYVAVEDFLHAITTSLWRTFWRKSGPLPFLVYCPRGPRSKFYTVEKAIYRGRLSELCGLALVSRIGDDLQLHWNKLMVFVLYKPSILSEGNELKLSASVICEALFYGCHALIRRSLDRSGPLDFDSVFILVLDSNFGGVVKLGGDVSEIGVTVTPPSDSNSNSCPYEAASEWIMNHCEVCVSPVDQIWNKFGNANWGDLGTLQFIMATFYSIVQWNGPPRKSLSSMASGHSLRLQKRRMECCLPEREVDPVPFESISHQNGEIIEVDDNGRESIPSLRKNASRVQFEPGEVLLLDINGTQHQEGPRSFQVQESHVGGNDYLYSAVSLDHPSELLSLYVGAHPSRLEPSWEDMSLWYQVQRQIKVLNTLRLRGVASKNLPELVVSGRIQHPGPCIKDDRSSPVGTRCNHPSCGTPILVSRPVGEPLSFVIARDGLLPYHEATRICRDCLSALRSASMVNIHHGDICPENIVRVASGKKPPLNILTSWGRAVLEDRDSPAVNLQFSSSHALRHGKLCPSSDAESLVYLLLFVCGGAIPQHDSIESALQWRERSWARRSIQSQLGEVNALLKAFADYVDSLCGTPYPVDYDIWVRRLSAAVDGSAHKGKTIEEEC
ncbi:hypothetical protein SAY87_013706 [Trapa incisa]|uniref:Uncharacterized protein n=1 Tax=Trapa incisa TaxID=236973 RepID=A0AAN7QDN8_9MYRT|nr:hypothetical protein SAY87_013706 [Trapa incisa]